MAFPGRQERIDGLIAVQRVAHVGLCFHRLAHLRGGPVATHRGDGRAPELVVAAPAQGRDLRQRLGAPVRGLVHRVASQRVQSRDLARLSTLRGGRPLPGLLLQCVGQFELMHVRQALREEHGRAELPRIAEADQLHLAVHDRAGRRIAGAEVDSNAHASPALLHERALF